MPSLPTTGFLRMWQIIGDRKRAIPPVFPVSRSSWWAGVKSGRYPKPVKLGPRITAWRVEDILALIENGLRRQDVGPVSLPRRRERDQELEAKCKVINGRQPHGPKQASSSSRAKSSADPADSSETALPS